MSVPDWSDLDRAWLAGLLEGEGAFIPHRRRGRVYPTVSLKMTDRDVVDRAADLMGGRVHLHHTAAMRARGWKPQFKTSRAGREGALLMRRLRPLMGGRRGARIDEVLSEYDALPQPLTGPYRYELREISRLTEESE